MNNVSLIGNLATDVDSRDVGDGKKKASFLLAVNRGGRDAGADFIWIAAWERQAELCAEYLAKGQRVGVAGRIQSHTWEKNGERRDKVEVVARHVEFLTAPNRETSANGAEVFPFEAATA